MPVGGFSAFFSLEKAHLPHLVQEGFGPDPVSDGVGMMVFRGDPQGFPTGFG